MIDDMIYLIGQSINVIGQIILFSLPPFIGYIISKRRIKGFLEYIGIKKVNRKSYITALKITGLTYIFSVVVLIILRVVQGEMATNSLADAYAHGGIIFIGAVILFGLQTGISEEILFRGFLGKWFIRRFGFGVGNTLQAIVFMLPHMMTFGQAPLLESVLGLVNAAIMGFVFGYIMEKRVEGSIIPGIVCHGIVNVVSIIIINML